MNGLHPVVGGKSTYPLIFLEGGFLGQCYEVEVLGRMLSGGLFRKGPFRWYCWR
jgi:hypothetical protein